MRLCGYVCNVVLGRFQPRAVQLESKIVCRVSLHFNGRAAVSRDTLSPRRLATWRPPPHHSWGLDGPDSVETVWAWDTLPL